MSGRDEMLEYASPYSMEMADLAASDPRADTRITNRLLGMVADTVAYPLYQHLRPQIGLPPWWQLLYAAHTIPGARIVRHGGGCYSTLVPLDGAELNFYRLTPTMIGTLYTFDIDYWAGMGLLHGLPWWVLQELSLWFAHGQPPLAITIEDYLRAIAAASIQ